MSVFDGAERVTFLHAHPDDETLVSGALIIDLFQRGIDVGVVTATRGELGGVVAGPMKRLEGTDLLFFERERELDRALSSLGVERHTFLGLPPARAAGLSPKGYLDSGMRWIRPGVAGPAFNASSQSFVRFTDEAVADMVALLRAWPTDVLVSYDESGGYFHPDHVHCHVVAGLAAAEAGIPFAEIVTPAHAVLTDDIEWVDRPDLLPDVSTALRCHRTQLTVHEGYIVHSGGQVEDIVTRTGVRLAKPVTP